MTQFLAILKDSLRESIDRKALFVLLILSGLVIAYCLGISYETRPVEEVFEKHADEVGTLRRAFRGGRSSTGFGTKVTVSDSRRVTSSDELDPDVADGFVVEMTFEKAREIDELVANWASFQEHGHRGDSPEVTERTPEERAKFLQERFLHEGWQAVDARATDAEALSYLLAVATDDIREVNGGPVP